MRTKNNERIANIKSDSIRKDWAEAFAKYATEGEDGMLLEANLPMGVTVKQKLNDILLAVSWREISNQYFGKNSVWLYHMLDGVDDKGNLREFTVEELQQLKQALYDLADRIRRAADNL